jgi:hypothetical protein
MNAAGSRRPPATGWVGWIAFGAVMMLITGFFNVIDGLAAIFSDQIFVQGDAGMVVLDLTAWGWWNTIFGIFLIGAGFALFQGATWARFTAIVLVVANGATQALFLPAYPIWSVLIIVIDMLVLWALIVHGDEQVIR